MLFKKKAKSADYFGITEVTKVLHCSNLVVSYPKCGRSWARFALARYLANVRGTEFDNKKDVNEYVGDLPTLGFCHDGTSFTPINFTAEEWPADQSVYQDKRIVLMVRDLRDAMVSFYHHCKERECVYEGTISEYVRDPRFGIAKPVRFLNRWVEARHEVEDFMVVRYEDMRANPPGELLRMASFLGYPDDNGAATEAAEYASFGNMKQLERSGALSIKGQFGAGKSGTEDSFKVRRGAMGGWKDELSADDAEYLTHYLNENLSPYYGYRCA